MTMERSPAMSAKQRSRGPTVLERQRAEEEAALKAQTAGSEPAASLGEECDAGHDSV